MAEKEGKKRKRVSNGGDAPSKKAAVEVGGNINVTFAEENGLHPVVASLPGLSAPQIPFEPYVKPLSNRHNNATFKPSTHDLLLHSSKHPRLDYTASSSSLDQHTSHYIAVFDPASNKLQITPAHHLSLHSTPRKSNQPQDGAKKARTFAQQREALGQAFGTKKARKVIASRTENSIVKAGATGKSTDVQAAILGAVDEATAATPLQSELDESLLASKPIPKPNLSAENVEDVYPFSTLVPPAEARLLPTKDWQDSARANEEITFSHRFPARRVARLGKTDDLQKLKALRYLALLLDFHDALQSAGRSGKKVPKKDILQKKLSAWPDQLVDSVRRRFATPQNELPKWNMDNLYCHMCALSLYVDGWETNTTDLKDDLKMESKQIVQYFQELGCRVGPPTERDRERFNIVGGKAQAAVVRVAKLKVPVEFPKVRVGRRK